MKMAKILSAVIACAMSVGALSIPALADDGIIEVNATNAQEILNGIDGSIDGKTICFTENIDTVLTLASPSRYEGSKTSYFKNDGTQVDDYSKLNANENSPTYKRTVSGVTFTAKDKVTIAGFSFHAGSVNSGAYDPIRDINLGGGYAYNNQLSLENITFKNLTFTGSSNYSLQHKDSVVNNITFDNCTFLGTNRTETNIAIRMQTDNGPFNNITIINCDINDYFQGVFIQDANNVYISNNTIKNTSHNAIALQSTSYGHVCGTITVKENYIDGAKDRAIRLGNVADADITINNNIMVNSGNDKGELIKAGTVDAAAKINLENNYWNGAAAETAVNALPLPEKTGVAGGTFGVDVSKYLAEGCEMVVNGDGTYSVKEDKSLKITTKNIGAKTGAEDSVATGFLTTVKNAGLVNTIQWTVTSNGKSQNSGAFDVNMTLNGDARFGLVVDGLYDAQATAEAAIN